MGRASFHGRGVLPWALAKKLRDKNVDVVSLIVNKLRKGSLIVEYIVSVNKISSSDPQTTLTSALLIIKSEGIELNGTTILVTNVLILNVNSPATCEQRQLTNPCKSTEVCVVEGNSAVCKSADSSDDKNRLTLGLAIGLPLFALLCIVVAVLVWKKCSGEKMKISDSNLYLQSSAILNSSSTGYTREVSKGSWTNEMK
ncbi:hypothetical protein Btru_057456 [Bulinus truncatus]|nr:hypothetical protein Btru_057456 [Bulinus truncatus]